MTDKEAKTAPDKDDAKRPADHAKKPDSPKKAAGAAPKDSEEDLFDNVPL